MSIEKMFQQMFYNDFSEKGAQIRRIDGNIEQQSKNDKTMAFMADIEVMFHQVHIPGKGRSFLRYLRSGRMLIYKTYYEMCLHVFCGTSSPGCCNYTLRGASLFQNTVKKQLIPF